MENKIIIDWKHVEAAEVKHCRKLAQRKIKFL